MESTMEPAFDAVSDAIEAIMLTMHKEDFAIEQHFGKKPSLYMREMESFVKRVVQEHFQELRAKVINGFLARLIITTDENRITNYRESYSNMTRKFRIFRRSIWLHWRVV